MFVSGMKVKLQMRMSVTLPKKHSMPFVGK